MTDLSKEEHELIDQFNQLDKEEQEELIVNLGIETVRTTMQILFPEKEVQEA
jgi:DNA-directed RNA polymerase subunit H (RpoH/RPB5)